VCASTGADVTAEEVAQKYASRPGYDLVSYGAVGLPFYRIAITAHVLEHKPIGPFAEYALRAVGAGITETGEIERLLGLDAAVVDVTLADLVSSDDLALQRDAISDGGILVLTPKGRTTLESTTAIVPEEAVIEIDYDGLLRKPVPYIERWLAPVELEKQGLREIPPSPTRPPDLKDIDIAAVENLIRILGDRREAKRELLTFKALERRRRFQPAVALVYRGQDATDVQVGFAIDGILSPDHEDAFARSRSKRKLIGGDGIEPAEAVIARIVGKQVLRQARPVSTEPGQVVELSGSGEELIVEPADPDAEIAAKPAPLQMLQTYEHPSYLQLALKGAQDRLLIISPWVRRSVVSRQFVDDLETKLKDGVDVFIGWGFAGLQEDDSDIDRNVLADLEQLKERYPWTLNFRRLGNTHAKILICDNRFMIVTSFNWLSFKGDPKRTFRDERGMYVEITDQIESQFKEWSVRISSKVREPKAVRKAPRSR
jgi:hypothetical protein